MDPLSLAAFEERASSAEARLAALEAKLAGGAGASGAGSSAELLSLREVLVTARAAAEKESAEASARIKAVEEENLKLKYQIMHLKRALVEADGAK